MQVDVTVTDGTTYTGLFSSDRDKGGVTLKYASIKSGKSAAASAAELPEGAVKRLSLSEVNLLHVHELKDDVCCSSDGGGGMGGNAVAAGDPRSAFATVSVTVNPLPTHCFHSSVWRAGRRDRARSAVWADGPGTAARGWYW